MHVGGRVLIASVREVEEDLCGMWLRDRGQVLKGHRPPADTEHINEARTSADSLVRRAELVARVEEHAAIAREVLALARDSTAAQLASLSVAMTAFQTVAVDTAAACDIWAEQAFDVRDPLLGRKLLSLAESLEAAADRAAEAAAEAAAFAEDGDDQAISSAP